MKLIPAIDIKNGSAIYKEFGNDPFSVVSYFMNQGVTCVHLVDMDGVLKNSTENIVLIKNILLKSTIKIELNPGSSNLKIYKDIPLWQMIIGVTSEKDLRFVTDAISLFGVHKCTVSFSYSKSDEITGLITLASYCSEHGISRFILRNQEADGNLSGISLNDVIRFKNAVSGELVVSGGISSMEDLGLLKNSGVEGAIVGKALYSGVISI
jgi:phosphoribosylformimino-5-aminoimidazole carboxamide ribotide isomerase